MKNQLLTYCALSRFKNVNGKVLQNLFVKMIVHRSPLLQKKKIGNFALTCYFAFARYFAFMRYLEFEIKNLQNLPILSGNRPLSSCF